MLWIEVDRTSQIPIIRQVYQQLRDKILKGELVSGEKIPGSRELASHLHISRNVILEAYHMLLLEGYIITKPNVGTFISEGTLLRQNILSSPQKTDDNEILLDQSNLDRIDFRSGIPALDLLPLKKWSHIKSQVYLDSSYNIFGYTHPKGCLALRNSICKYLLRIRGLSCHPEQVVITSGSIQSFSILSNLLLKNNDIYIIEDPLHIEIKKTFAFNNPNCYSIPVDQEGLQTQLLPSTLNPKFIFITPSHQYPLGEVLPVQRRIELIEYARSKNCYIVEDDYDSEFHYMGAPVSTLYELAPDSVIYVGTFSKILFPALRIGYIILPPILVDSFCEYKKRSDYFTSVVDQITLSQFIDQMFLDRHVHKMRKIYLQRRNALIESLNSSFGSSVTIHGESTGLHLIASFKDVQFTEDLVSFIALQGLKIHPVWLHSSFKNFQKNSIIIGYSHLNHQLINKGIKLLKESLTTWHLGPPYTSLK
ncbi:MocR-like pyridoxine biosynthesis transcription factor PdxR [Cellulosilyticum sp. I15G10I2]|uniref:MocR-like pyridoxine biosynthesis transcription factor PdxR n=1 Tax=Cellulosilyticum sp. I15G10I2 TaxID=1892843 RepID=UPI00085CAFCD|nr:PLP-dependent aminotransferase family protein [Cellulosilyticum sp. I15G10I2]